MPRNWHLGLIFVALLAAGCAGSTAPIGGPDPQPQLTYELSADPASFVDASGVSGEGVMPDEALDAYGGAELPQGFSAVQGAHFTPETAPGEGFEGELSMSVGEGHSASQVADGSLLFLYYVSPAGGAQFVDSSRSQAGWVRFTVNMLGYFVIARNNSVPAVDGVFTVHAFADLAEAFVSEEINFWAVAQNGMAPYAFTWDFGDGAQQAGDQATHAYLANGEYTVDVTVTDGDGLVATAFSTPIVIGGSPGGPVTVTVDVTPDPASEVNFTYQANVTGGNPPYSYDWDFDGDGTTDSTAGALVDFDHGANGLYAGTLTVNDSLVEEGQATFVTDARHLSLAADPLVGGAPLEVTFDITALGFAVGDMIMLTFGDGVIGDVTIAANQEVYQLTHNYVIGTFAPQATGTTELDGTDYEIQSNSLEIIVIQGGLPVIQFTQPIVPGPGAPFEIKGYFFGDNQGARSVRLDETTLAVTQWGDTSIMVTYPAGFNGDMGDLMIVDPDSDDSNAVQLNMNPVSVQRSVQNVLPPTPSPGERVLIIGHGFGNQAETVAVGQFDATVEAWHDGWICAVLAAGTQLGSQQLRLSSAVAAIATYDLEIVASEGAAYPTLDAATPPVQEMGVGALMALQGTGFGTGYGGLVACDGQLMNLAAWNDTQINIGDPDNPVDGWAVVINGSLASNPLNVAFLPRPHIDDLDPDFAVNGATVRILGTDFGAQQMPGDQVTLGGNPLAVDLWSDVEIQVTIPAGANDGNIIVAKKLLSNAVPFDVIPPAPGTPGGQQI